jgi:hypothetical protein
MKFGLDLPIHGPYSDPNLLLEIAVEAEAAGWDGFFLWDHIAMPGKAPQLTDPWMVLAAAAVKTEWIFRGRTSNPAFPSGWAVTGRINVPCSGLLDGTGCFHCRPDWASKRWSLRIQ